MSASRQPRTVAELALRLLRKRQGQGIRPSDTRGSEADAGDRSLERRLERWLARRRRPVTVDDIVRAFGWESRPRRFVEMQIAAILPKLGWRKQRRRTAGVRAVRYERDAGQT